MRACLWCFGTESKVLITDSTTGYNMFTLINDLTSVPLSAWLVHIYLPTTRGTESTKPIFSALVSVLSRFLRKLLWVSLQKTFSTASFSSNAPNLVRWIISKWHRKWQEIYGGSFYTKYSQNKFCFPHAQKRRISSWLVFLCFLLVISSKALRVSSIFFTKTLLVAWTIYSFMSAR